MSNNFEIPKHIYQTFETWENIPETFKKRIKITRTINKNYEYHFYDNKNCEKYILDTYGKDIFDIYNSISKDYNAARADLFRYLIIYDKV
jgi:inositol phosphorylceramide mannosyltransferase catalytic subunit